MKQITIEELKNVIALKDLPEEHLKWLLDHSEQVVYEDGDVIGKTGDPADWMYILIEGRVDFYLNVNSKLVYYYHFTNDEVTGGISGMLPYSRMKVFPGNSISVGNVRALRLHKKYFQELERLNPEFIQRLIGYMTERARFFASTQMQQEKVSALGKLAAGIAHELNNPASAINRISHDLRNRLFLNIELTEILLKQNIDADHISYLRKKLEEKENSIKPKLSAVQRMNREDELMQWFQEKKFPADQQVVDTFTESGFSSGDLENLSDNVPKTELLQIILWIENLLSSERIIKDLAEASARISNLVGAIKSHVHMDRTNEKQPTDLHQDIENTLTLLGYKLREKNILVNKSFCSDIAPLPAYVGELNQVWTNIIDNAIYAMDKGGELTVETKCDQKNVYVNIIDNGAGIPAEIISRIFDPFFTTKKVGDGTGLGLDIVQRIIKRHNGEIKVRSYPGKTEFHLCLPLS
ncbi:MAG: Adaptive-response sensory-kinase SasA [Ignavibacteriaceae bacterium]|nr:Adaptive-response sensory-kinase SasA [Ignavibacteriaceae bacterium]